MPPAEPGEVEGLFAWRRWFYGSLGSIPAVVLYLTLGRNAAIGYAIGLIVLGAVALWPHASSPLR